MSEAIREPKQISGACGHYVYSVRAIDLKVDEAGQQPVGDPMVSSLHMRNSAVKAEGNWRPGR